MSQIVKLRRSSTGGNRPTNSQLQLGELAINTTDGKIYFSKSGSLNTSIEEVLTTNAQNTGSLNLSGSFNLIGTENITGSLNTTGSLRVLGDTSLTSLVVSGSDPVANVQAFVPDSTIYNAASFNTPNRVASGIRFNWNSEDWTIGAARGLTTDIDGLIFSKNGVRKYMIDEDGNASLSGSMYITGALYIDGNVVGTGKLDETTFNSYTSSVSSTFAGTSSYALTASYVANPVIVSGSTKKTTVTSASTTWSLAHNMNERYPSITVFDSDGYVVIPTGVRAIDSNNIEVYFSEAQTGTVIATLGGSGAVGVTGAAGSSGTSGRDGIGGYTQTYTSATTWSVAHNLDLDYPGVTVWDSNRKVIIPSEITSIDSNNLQITFPIAQAGEVHIVRGGHMVSGSQDLSAVGTITPSADGLYNLGSSLKQFNNVYISGSLLVNGVPYSSGAVDTGSFAITGSNTFKGNQVISGSLSITGTTEFGGNLVPKEARGATLGTLERPFKEIYVSSGSINIASDTPGDPNTNISNIGGNLLVSAGGMRLLGNASFIAATGSFQYISGSMEQFGNYTQTGNYVMVGNKTITGSLNITGSLKLNGLSAGSTSDNLLTINPTTKVVGSITGLTASQIPTRYYGAFYDLTTQTGATNVSQSVQLGNTQHSNGVSIVSGSRVTVANAGIYNLQFSTQLYRASGGSTVNTYIWFRVNGVNVTNSTSAVTTNNNNGYTIASWNYVDVYNAGDYVELMWMPDGANVSLQYINAPAGLPSIPSTILTLTQV
jgi:cytoskeletal protein CcmA (bactofilin family)